MRPIIKYPGSKWSIAQWIINFFPDHHSYLEPFFGSGAVLFTKPRSNIETVNDLDGNVVNFFRWVKTNPERLAQAVYYTPYARQVHDLSYTESEDSFERALNFCIRLNMGHGFRTNGERVGWKNDIQGREKAYAASDWCNLPDRIIQAAERLRGVQIENRPAVELMQRFNNKKVLVYLDPPYVLSTRCCKQYKHEMDDAAHIELLETAKAHKGPVLISGYDTDLYNDLLQGWHKETTTSRTQTGETRTETLWMNFNPGGQMDIFDYPEVNPGKG